MTAITTTLLYAPDVQSRQRWLTVAEASRLSQLPERTIRDWCENGKLFHKYVTNPAPTGRRTILLIDINHAGPEFSPQAVRSRAQEAILAKMTPKQRKKAMAKLEVIQSVEGHLKSMGAENGESGRSKAILEEFLRQRKACFPEKFTPSVRTYYRMRARYLKYDQSLTAMVDRRGLPGQGVAAEFTQEAWEFFVSMYGTKNKVPFAICYRDLCAMATMNGNNWTVPSATTVQRRWNSLPLRTRTELRQGSEAAHQLCDSDIERDWTKLKANEVWVSDHCQFDIIGFDDFPGGTGLPCRMWLTTWMDEASRMIMGYRIHRGPNSKQVMASYVQAVLANGIPSFARMDNGKDYRCDRFAGGRKAKSPGAREGWYQEIERVDIDTEAVQPMLAMLKCQPIWAMPYNARAKICETWHNHWVHDEFDRSMPGYCGGSIDRKPEDLNDVVKKGNLLKWSQIAELFKELLAAYNSRSHSGIGGQSPQYRRQQLLSQSPIRTASLGYLHYLLQDQRVLTVKKNGIEVDDCTYGVESPELWPLIGHKVRVRLDTYYAGVIYVYDLQDRWICDAVNNPRLEARATREDAETFIRDNNRRNKLRKQMDALGFELTAPDPVLALALKRQASANDSAELPTPTTEVLYQPLELEPGMDVIARPFTKQLNSRLDIGTVPMLRAADAPTDETPEPAAHPHGTEAPSHEKSESDPWAAFSAE